MTISGCSQITQIWLLNKLILGFDAVCKWVGLVDRGELFGVWLAVDVSFKGFGRWFWSGFGL